MRTCVLALLIATFLPAGALKAEEPTKEAQIEELLSLLNIDRMTEQSLAQLPQQLKQMAPADPGLSQKFLEKMMPLIREKMSYARLKPEYVRIYSEVLTEPEIAPSLRFYRSPEGQSLLQKMPTLMNRSMEVGQKAFSEILPEMQRIMQELKDQEVGGKK